MIIYANQSAPLYLIYSIETSPSTFGCEHLANAILYDPRFSVVNYIKQKVPVQQDRPQHSIVRQKEEEEEGEREKES